MIIAQKTVFVSVISLNIFVLIKMSLKLKTQKSKLKLKTKKSVMFSSVLSFELLALSCKAPYPIIHNSFSFVVIPYSIPSTSHKVIANLDASNTSINTAFISIPIKPPANESM